MKKIFYLTVCFVLMLTFSSCSSSARPDIMRIAQRLTATDEKYSFDYFDMFIYDNVYHVYLSLCEEDDVMISFETDTDGNVNNVTVTAFADSMNNPQSAEELCSLFCAVIDSFATLSQRETDEMNSALSFCDTAVYFTDVYETFTSLRNNFVFSSNSRYMCLYCDYYEIMSG